MIIAQALPGLASKAYSQQKRGNSDANFNPDAIDIYGNSYKKGFGIRKSCELLDQYHPQDIVKVAVPEEAMAQYDITLSPEVL